MEEDIFPPLTHSATFYFLQAGITSKRCFLSRMQKSGVVLCALRVFAVKVLSFRHSYRKDANEDNNNFSAQDAIAMVALTARY